MTYAFDDGLHKLDVLEVFLEEKSIYFIHLRKQGVNRVVSTGLIDDFLPNIAQILSAEKCAIGRTLETTLRMDHAALA